MKTNIRKEVKNYNQQLQDELNLFPKDKVLFHNVLRFLLGSILIKKEPDKISSSNYAKHTLVIILSSFIIGLIFMPILVIYINLLSIFSPLTFIFKLSLALLPAILAFLGASFTTIYVSILKEEFKTLPTIKLSKLFICELTKLVYWLSGACISICIFIIFMYF